LVVALESDKRIRKTKGKGRPINTFEIRERNLIRLNEVSFVLKLADNFGSKKERLNFLRLIEPKILAISSGDSKEKEKRKECQEAGCQLKIVYQYNPEVSTTKLLLDRT